jgi:hypothetical protein
MALIQLGNQPPAPYTNQERKIATSERDDLAVSQDAFAPPLTTLDKPHGQGIAHRHRLSGAPQSASKSILPTHRLAHPVIHIPNP